MSYLTAFLLFIPLIHGLAPAALNPVINLPASSNPSTLQLLNLSNTANDADLVNATSGVIRCLGKDFGYNLNKASCDEVWKKIPTDSGILSFGARRAGTFERPLPYRYLSGKISPVYLSSITPFTANSSHADDGLCAIDVDIMQNFDSDTATNHDISTAAKSVLDKCVFRDVTRTRVHESVGGIQNGVGPYQAFLSFQNQETYLHSLISSKLTQHRASRQAFWTQCQSLLLQPDRGMRARPSSSRKISLFEPDGNHAGRRSRPCFPPNERSDFPKNCDNPQESSER